MYAYYRSYSDNDKYIYFNEDNTKHKKPILAKGLVEYLRKFKIGSNVIVFKKMTNKKFK